MSIQPFVQFLNRSPTVYHAAQEIAQQLKQAGFLPLHEHDRWKLEWGKSYFLVRQDTLVAAFRMPKSALQAATILANHIDSPALKLKPQAEIQSQGIGQLGTEVYGAPLLHSWLDRDLAIAGRITGLDAHGKGVSQLVFLENSPVIIPQLAIHLDRSIQEKGILVHKQDHLKAIFSIHPKEHALQETLKKHHSLAHVLSSDLFLVPLEKASFVGFDQELIASYRLDNLTAAYASLHAILHAKAQGDTLQMALFWDHEEIGSMSYVGADSLFAHQLLERIAGQCALDLEDFHRMKSRSLCLSGDLAHGYHPNYADKYDLPNAPFLGKGVILKFNANQKYATSSPAAASLVHLAETQKISLQKFASRSDIPSGSTVGSILAANLGISTLDLGIAGWAMHSAREVVSVQDMLSFCHLLTLSLEQKLLPIEARYA